MDRGGAGGEAKALAHITPGFLTPGGSIAVAASPTPGSFVFPHLLGHHLPRPRLPHPAARPGSGRVTASAAEWRPLFPSIKQL